MMIKKTGKALLAGMLALSIGVTAAACGSKTDIKATTADPERTFSFWISTVDGTGAGGVYDKYEQNPGVVFLTDREFTYKTSTKNADGSYTLNDTTQTNNIALNYLSPAPGASAQTSFITSLNSADILELSYSPDSITTLYENGQAMDLTYWVENYMPNYLAYIEEHGLGNLVTNEVNGERKYLQIYNYTVQPDSWQGYQYRRDWILEFGETFDENGTMSGKTFKEANPSWGWQDYGSDNAKWVDEIVFPSWYGLQYTTADNGKASGMGTLTKSETLYNYIRNVYKTYADERGGNEFPYEGQWPVTISDWEWMLDIFQIALEESGYASKGYCMTLYQSGFINTGNLVSSFGGGGPEWYVNPNTNTVEFGGESDTVKTYLKTMNQWYANGWIDTGFQSNSESMFWHTGEQETYGGYSGIYCAQDSTLLGQMDISEGYEDDPTYGICSYGMPLPVNDKYGSEAQQYQDPYVFYILSAEAGSCMVSTKAANKDLPALFTFLDYLYTKEAGIVNNAGLTKEQVENSQEGVQKLYEEFGLVNGANFTDEEGVVRRTLEFENLDTTSRRYFQATRWPAGAAYEVHEYAPNDLSIFRRFLWKFYDADGYIENSFYDQLSAGQYKAFQTAQTQMRNSYLSNVPGFIKGEKDVDSAWDTYINGLKKDLGIDRLTTALNSLLQEL